MKISGKKITFLVLCLINLFVLIRAIYNMRETKKQNKDFSVIVNKLIDSNLELLKCTESINDARILILNYKNEQDTVASILSKDKDFKFKYDSLRQDARIHLRKSRRIYESILKGKK